MKNLNKKGMTLIEVIVCFLIVVIITSSLFITLNNYKDKQQLESDRATIIKYKNLLTKTIQDDLIKKSLKSATISKNINNDRYIIYDINLIFKDDSTKTLEISKKLAAYSTDDITAAEDQDDYFAVTYDEIKYILPNIGYTTNYNGKIVYDLKYNNLYINTDNNILTIYIGFYHPNFGKRYAIDIVCPISYE